MKIKNLLLTLVFCSQVNARFYSPDEDFFINDGIGCFIWTMLTYDQMIKESSIKKQDPFLKSLEKMNLALIKSIRDKNVIFGNDETLLLSWGDRDHDEYKDHCELGLFFEPIGIKNLIYSLQELNDYLDMPALITDPEAETYDELVKEFIDKAKKIYNQIPHGFKQDSDDEYFDALDFIDGEETQTVEAPSRNTTIIDSLLNGQANLQDGVNLTFNVRPSAEQVACFVGTALVGGCLYRQCVNRRDEQRESCSIQ